MSSETAIEVMDLSKCYHIYDRPQDRLIQMLTRGRKQRHREFWALREASFSIARGETVGIIGRNGSGKSTLLQMICGTVSPTSGTVAVNGRVAALLELGAGFDPEFTGRENVLLNAAILGFSRESMGHRMKEVAEFSELGDFLDRPVKTYSTGMYARLAFSVAIHVDPEILIVDEALAVGDSRFVAKCMRRMREIQDRGVTIVFVSHDVNSVRTLCQRAIWLDEGRIVENGEVFPVTGKYMEFMFKDDESERQTLREEIATEQKAQVEADNQESVHEADDLENLPETRGVQPVSDPSDSIAVLAGNDIQTLPETSTATESLLEPKLDARPVTHWGSRKGLIIGASVCDETGARTDVIAWGTQIELVIDVFIPLDIPRDNLSIAGSIKDLKGTDLIVSTTKDLGAIELPHQERFRVCFRMTNPLVTGKYLLVVAVENRLEEDIHYYEYIEGAHYFSSLADENFFGIFQPEIRQTVEVL
jgi:lipopolysaccharide transport system ATP-binding protein